MPTSVDTTPPKHSKLPKHRAEILDPSDPRLGGFQLLDLIITELKSHMTC
jgi:hypothetical protein